MKKLLLILLLLCVPYARAQTSPGNIQMPGVTTALNAVTTNTNSSPVSVKLYGAIALDVTITGGTVNVTLKGRIDTASTYRTLLGYNDADGTSLSTITASGSYTYGTAGKEDVEVFTTSISGATVTVKVRPIPSVGKAFHDGEGGGGLTVGTTAITGGTSGRVLFDSAGVVGEDADLAFVTDTLTATKVVAPTSVTIGAGSPITSSGAGGALGSNAFSSTSFATAARAINTTSPLGGGGDLSSDRTLTCTTCITGSGTANALPKFTAGTTLGNSRITDDGTVVILPSKTGIGGTPTNTAVITNPILDIRSGTLNHQLITGTQISTSSVLLESWFNENAGRSLRLIYSPNTNSGTLEGILGDEDGIFGGAGFHFTTDASGNASSEMGDVFNAYNGTYIQADDKNKVVTISADNGIVLPTVTAGVWSGTVIALNKGGTGQTTKAAAFDALSPMSASGDILYGGTSGTGTRLAKGTDGQVLTLASGLPTWAAASGGLSNPLSAGSVSSNALQIVQAGTGLYQPATNVLGLSANGIDALRLNTVTSGVNYLTATPSATGNNVIFGTSGSDATVGLTITPKGNGTILLNTTERIQIGGTSANEVALRKFGSYLGFEAADDSGGGKIKAQTVDVQSGSFSSVAAVARVEGNNTTQPFQAASTGGYCWTSTSTITGSSPTITTCLHQDASGIAEVNNGTAGTFRDIISRTFFINSTTVKLTSGSGSPEGAVTAPVGSLYTRTDGGASTTLYVKESGSNTNTGWVAK